MRQFRRLMLVALLSGTLAGLVLFALQQIAVAPLIEQAEQYEAGEAHQTTGGSHEHDEWKPAEGWQRAGFTALTTVLGAVGFAALLFGFLALTGRTPNMREGALWGLSAFACFHLAPAMGLPPEPPGVAAADLGERQLWWAGTVVATSVGLWLLVMPAHTWMQRSAGAVCILLPHVFGAPGSSGESVTPPELIRRFTFASLATSALFWPLLGAIGGKIMSRGDADAVKAKKR